ncbi:CPBP family intramembrane glutamic endopeptidase [Christiangramia aquimixticola]|uniref:CPBP family intramembrane glutamic endopeptidase n=1 Tax=Christiangramia aquimixticola TaxID=1697558 RepID=UPI003AA7D978
MIKKRIEKYYPLKFFTKYPVIAFVTLTFLITYGIGVPADNWLSTTFKFPHPLDIYIPRFLTVTAPAISAMILMWVNRKKFELNIFRYFKKPAIFYFLIPLSTFLISIITLIMAGVSPEILWNSLRENWHLLYFHLILQVFIIGLGEEIGWRGWLLPKLNEQFGLLKATFILLIIWILWHFLILFSDVAILIPWLMIITGLTFTLSWTWIKFGNTAFLFAIIHGSVNFPQFFWDNLSAVEPQLQLKNWEISGYVYLSIGLIALVLLLRSAKQSDKRLSHPQIPHSNKL